MKELARQLPRFLVSGGSAVATDLISYFFLLEWFSAEFAKGISFLLGTVVAFVLNKFWTFEQADYRHAEVGRFIILYSTTLVVNVAVNSSVLYFLPGFTVLAFFIATGVSTVLNFLGQKFWVFNH